MATTRESSLEYRRTKVDELLRSCCDHKLLSCDSRQALRLADEALRLAEAPEPLPAPWPQLARYRKAHLLLRTARKYDELEEVEQLLSRACDESAEQQPLGPLPLLYRLAVLTRLSALETSKQRRKSLAQLIARVFAAARDSIERKCVEDGAREEVPEVQGPLQKGWFNMLELAAYFLGADYRPLEGWGQLDVMDYAPEDAWLLVSQDRLAAKVRMNRDLAEAELADRAARCPDAVLFRLTPDQSECRLARNKEASWRSISEPGLHALAGLMMGEFRSRDALLDHVAVLDHAEEAHSAVQSNRLRKLTNDLHATLRELLGKHVNVLRSRPVRNSLPEVSKEPLIFGLIHEKTFRERPCRRR